MIATSRQALEDYIRPAWLTEQWLKDNNYEQVKLLTAGEWAGSWACLSPMLFSWRLLINLDETGWSACYDFPDKHAAELALIRWDGQGDPPGPWLKYKGRGGEREGPGLSSKY